MDAKKRPLAASASHASTIPWRAALPQEGSAAQTGRQARDVKRRGEDANRLQIVNGGGKREGQVDTGRMAGAYREKGKGAKGRECH